MRVQNFERLTHESIPGAPREPWVEQLFEVVNRQLESVTTALQGRIGIENENAANVAMELQHGITSVVTASIKGIVSEVRAIRAGTALESLVWTQTGAREIEVTPYFRGSPATSVEVTLKVIGKES